MAERETERTWRNIHEDYIKFAVLSYRASKASKQGNQDAYHLGLGNWLNRDVIDTIRYSYDCLETSVEFIHHLGTLKPPQLHVPENWLTRYVDRKWDGLSLGEKIGMLTYAWLGVPFWQSEDEYQLFEDLKRVRVGLTHPVPFGMELDKEILLRQELQDGVCCEEWQPIGEPKSIGGGKMDFRPRKTVAEFSQNPCLLGADDAERALEIMLRHLSRLGRLFFGRDRTRFAFFDAKTGDVRPADDLLKDINCHFESTWSTDGPAPVISQTAGN